MNKGVMRINARFAEEAARPLIVRNKPVKEVLKAGMLATLQGNWLERADHHIFMAALAGVMQAYGIEHQESVRIVESAKRANVFEMYLQAIQQGIKAEPPPNAPPDHLFLLNYWMEVRAAFQQEQPRLFT